MMYYLTASASELTFTPVTPAVMRSSIPKDVELTSGPFSTIVLPKDKLVGAGNDSQSSDFVAPSPGDVLIVGDATYGVLQATKVKGQSSDYQLWLFELQKVKFGEHTFTMNREG